MTENIIPANFSYEKFDLCGRTHSHYFEIAAFICHKHTCKSFELKMYKANFIIILFINFKIFFFPPLANPAYVAIVSSLNSSVGMCFLDDINGVNSLY